MRWRLRGRTWNLGPADPVRVMGIVNATPDSFSDGGLHLDPERAIAHALALVAAGADLIDIGGESTRPGARPVSAAEEMARVLPVVSGLRARSSVAISVDTTKAAVAAAALDAGADVINDISGLTFDPAMAALAATRGAGVVLMHLFGTPDAVHAESSTRAATRVPSAPDARADGPPDGPPGGPADDPPGGPADGPAETGTAALETVGAVEAWLRLRLATLVAAGVHPEQVCFDPGIGFGKSDPENLALLAALPRLAAIGRPLLVGTSRKSLLGRLTGRAVGDRAAASAAADACSVLLGASILRVHDVAAGMDAARVAVAVRRALVMPELPFAALPGAGEPGTAAARSGRGAAT